VRIKWDKGCFDSPDLVPIVPVQPTASWAWEAVVSALMCAYLDFRSGFGFDSYSGSDKMVKEPCYTIFKPRSGNKTNKKCNKVPAGCFKTAPKKNGHAFILSKIPVSSGYPIRKIKI